MELIDNLALGFATALTLQNLFYCFIGVLIGTLIGMPVGADREDGRQHFHARADTMVHVFDYKSKTSTELRRRR